MIIHETLNKLLVPDKPEFYEKAHFGLFGRGYEVVEEIVMDHLRQLNSPDIYIAVRDINPKVFGENGKLRKLLEENTQNGIVKLIAKQDTENTFSKSTNNIQVIVDEDADKAFEQSCWRISYPFNLDKHEMLFAINHKNNNSLFMIYNRANDEYGLYQDHIESMDGVYGKYLGIKFEETWNMLKNSSKWYLYPTSLNKTPHTLYKLYSLF